MAKTVTITNGVGTAQLINDTYDITANVNGYNNSSIDPDSVEIVKNNNTYQFTIEAEGTLTLHVTDTGTAAGTPIVGATFVRCDSQGNTYGSPITSDSNGNAVFNNVPFAANNAPTIYYKQTASDGSHEFEDELQSTTLTTSTSTIQVQNPAAATRTINFYDANYENLPISGTLTFANE